MQWKSQEEIERAISKLPFPLANEDFEYITLKAAAMWSITSSCKELEDVWLVCATVAPEIVAGIARPGSEDDFLNSLPAGAQYSGHGRIASDYMYHGPPPFEIVGARTLALETVLVLLLGLAYLDLGDTVTVWFISKVSESTLWFGILSIALLVVAALVGAARQFFTRLLSQASAMVVVDDFGTPKMAYFGDVPGTGWQTSPWQRTVSWLFVLMTSIFGALIAARVLEVWFDFESWVPAFFIILAVRWFVSWLPTRAIATTQFNMEPPPSTGTQ